MRVCLGVVDGVCGSEESVFEWGWFFLRLMVDRVFVLNRDVRVGGNWLIL